MNTVRLIGIFYLTYSIYTLFIVSFSDYKLYHAFFGLLIVWLSYLFFVFGFNSFKEKDRPLSKFYQTNDVSFPLSDINSWNPIKFFLIVVITWIFAILTTKFYTGRNFISVISGLGGGEGAYYAYQNYFAENNLNSFSVNKIPYILMNAFLVIILIWSSLSTFIASSNPWWKKICVLAIILAYLYFGASRGTNFEVYIVFILFVFYLFQKMQNKDQMKKCLYVICMFLSAVFIVLIYQNRIDDRGVVSDYTICPEIHYDPSSFIGENFPWLAQMLISFFSYLGYGIYCIGTSIGDICFNSAFSCFISLIPGGFYFLGDYSLVELIHQNVIIQARWIPDTLQFVGSFGWILYFVFVYFMGRILKNIMTGMYPQLLKLVFQLVLLIEMLSLPVGNFLMVSSSNKIMVVFFVLYVLKCKSKISLI